MLKKRHYLQQATWIAFLARKTLKFGFLYFYKSCRELNFLSAVKGWPKVKRRENKEGKKCKEKKVIHKNKKRKQTIEYQFK